tara:strand:+ start:13312 stop:13686 length:375 start_codon:yes stop_codon:yes gene_type:complete
VNFHWNFFIRDLFSKFIAYTTQQSIFNNFGQHTKVHRTTSTFDTSRHKTLFLKGFVRGFFGCARGVFLKKGRFWEQTGSKLKRGSKHCVKIRVKLLVFAVALVWFCKRNSMEWGNPAQRVGANN